MKNIVRKWGKDRAIKEVWVPDVPLYQSERLSEGASPGTINREMATLSRLFQVMFELHFLEVNPVRLVKRLTERSGEREAYQSFQDVQEIISRCPRWFGPIILVAYCTGMRRAEILGLTHRQVNQDSLLKRLIVHGPEQTKERHRKRVPIHKELVSVFEEACKVREIGKDRVFLLDGRPPHFQSIKNPWRKAVNAMGLDPRPRFHDLRHTWKTNARRSGMDVEIREFVMGHWFRQKFVSERYGRISDQELTQAVYSMTFDHGNTEICARRQIVIGNKRVRKSNSKRKKAMLLHDLTD